MDFTIISKYRGELMGIGILEIMLLHFFSLQNLQVNSIIVGIINLVYTQGFLFLSGFGLYYSYTKNHNISSFFKRRFSSVMIPYMVIALPYYFYFFITNQQERIPIYSDSFCNINSALLLFLGRVSTIGYWLEGNYNGMWYIALTVILYAIFPILYRIFKIGGGKRYYIWLIIIIAFAHIGSIICRISPLYSQTIGHAIPHAYMFLVGMLFGKWSYNNESLNIEKLVILGVFCWTIPDIKTIMSMIILCYLFEIIDKNILMESFRKTLRWFGFYSLELYVLHLSLYALFVVIEDNSSMVVPIPLTISSVYVISIIMAVAVKKVADMLKLFVI